MQTTRILDNYRLSIADDKLATVLLAWLMQAGARTEDDIVGDLKLSRSDAKKKIDQLYRASYIENAPSQKWRTTHFGREVLTLLGITSGVTEFLISQFDIPKADTAFLTFYSTLFYGATKTDDRIVSRLKCARDIAEANESYFFKTKSLTKFLYAIIVGQSRAASILDTKALCTDLRNQLSDTSINTFHFSADAVNWAIAKRYCDQARLDVQRSNLHILHGSKGSGNSSLFTKLLTESRVLSALTTGELDDQLSFLHFSKENTDPLSNVVSDAKFLNCYRNAMAREGINVEGDSSLGSLEGAKRRLALIWITSVPSISPPEYSRRLPFWVPALLSNQNSADLDIAMEQVRIKLERMQSSSVDDAGVAKLKRLSQHITKTLSQWTKKTRDIKK